jgi:hypothetical protein
MAINIPIITEFSDAGLKSAQGAFNNFKTQVSQADGVMGKFKAGGAAALDAVKANALGFAAAGGAALAAFAAKSVMAFNETALAAGKFAEATGLSVEEASRWTEVAGDIGVEASTVQKAMDKLNKAIATGSNEFKELGAEVAYTSAGAVDVNKTFLNTVEALRRIEDPAKRAELASKTLGKGWQDMSELIAQGSNRLEDSLASVSDAKVINQEELERARQFRDSLDQLTDKGGDLAMTLGGALLPVLADLLGVLNTVITTVQKTAGAIQNFMSGIGGRGLENMVEMAKTQEEINTNLKESWEAYYSSRRAAERLATALHDTTVATEEADEAWQELLGSLSEQEAWNDVLDALDDVHKASYEALVSGTAEDARRAQSAVNDLTGDIYDYVRSLGNIPPNVQTQIVAALERGAFDEAIRLLDNIRSGATAVIVGTVSGIPVGPGETPSEVRPPGTNRPPQARPPAKIPSRPIAGAYGININVAGSVIAERDLIESVRSGLVNAQRNGAGLVYTNK